MALAEIFDGEALTGQHAAAILFAWLGLVILAGVALVVNIPA